MLCVFFWVIPRRLNFICRRLFTYLPMKMEKSVPKRRHIKFRRRGVTQKKTYIIIIIIIYLSWSWANCWPVPVSLIQKSLQRSAMIPSASWGIVCFVSISEQIANVALYNANWLVFITEMKSFLFTNWCTSEFFLKTILKFPLHLTLKQLRHVSVQQSHHHQGAHYWLHRNMSELF